MICFCQWKESTFCPNIDSWSNSCICCEMYDDDKYYKIEEINSYDSFGIKYLTRSKISKYSHYSASYIYKLSNFHQYVKGMISPEMIIKVIETIEDRVSYRIVPCTENKGFESRVYKECEERAERADENDFENAIDAGRINKGVEYIANTGGIVGKDNNTRKQ